MPRIVGHEGTKIKTACGESGDAGGEVYGAVIELVDCQFALQLYEGAEGVAGTFHHGEFIALRIHLQERGLKPSLSRHLGAPQRHVARITVSLATKLSAVKMAGWSMAG